MEGVTANGEAVGFRSLIYMQAGAGLGYAILEPGMPTEITPGSFEKPIAGPDARVGDGSSVRYMEAVGATVYMFLCRCATARSGCPTQPVPRPPSVECQALGDGGMYKNWPTEVLRLPGEGGRPVAEVPAPVAR